MLEELELSPEDRDNVKLNSVRRSIENFIFNFLDTKKFDFLYFDSKTSLWHIGKQPSIRPCSYQTTSLVDFCFKHKSNISLGADVEDKNSFFYLKAITNLKNIAYDTFSFNYPMNVWMASSDKLKGITTAPTFSLLLKKIC